MKITDVQHFDNEVRLTLELEKNGATRDKVIGIINGYGDAINWGDRSLMDIIGSVWESDINSGDESDGWIINEICRTFNVTEVTE